MTILFDDDHDSANGHDLHIKVICDGITGEVNMSPAVRKQFQEINDAYGFDAAGHWKELRACIDNKLAGCPDVVTCPVKSTFQ